MIVKDEESTLTRCLDSVKEEVDEIIIVDTGSSDRTREICLEYGASVLDMEWNNSFAQARNYGLKHATGDWILWLDADEELVTSYRGMLREIVANAEPNAPLLMIELINYYGQAPPDIHRSYTIAHHRLFRNHIGFKFIFDIHEQLNTEEVITEAIEKFTIVPVQIHHFGYMEEVIKNKNKAERNTSLLLQEKQKEGYRPWVDYHLANEYYRRQDHHKAFQLLNEAIQGFLAQHQLPPSLLYKLKYTILLELGSYAGASQGIGKAIALYPDYVDLYFYKGVTLFIDKQYNESLSVFKQCVQMGDTCSEHLVMKGVGSFFAQYYIGQCYEKLDDYQLAEKAYCEAIAHYPQFQEARTMLIKLRKHYPIGGR